MNTVTVILAAVALYLVAGIIFTIIFQLKGLSKIDEGTHGSSWGFRIMIIPGCIVFWTALLRKWMKVNKEIIDPAKEHA